MEITTESYFLGDSTICWSFGNTITKELNKIVLYLYKSLKESNEFKKYKILDIVPSFNALAIHFDSLTADHFYLRDLFNTLINNYLDCYTDDDKKGEIIKILVDYTGQDLERVAEFSNLKVEEVIELHTKPEYQVAMVGFKPHFPYLIGLDPKLETPRLESPRTSIPAGSVAIGGAQTGIYPEISPGGWNLIGQTDPSVLINIKPGDKIKLVRNN